jgi:Winged helix DNA-binding domain
VKPADVLAARLATQRLTSAPLASGAEVVDLLCCVQAQERDHSLYSLALRTGRTVPELLDEHSAGGFLRTHILRPTWHYVLPGDLRWILALTSARVESSMAARHRQVGLGDEATIGRAIDDIAAVLAGGNVRTRKELAAELTGDGRPWRAGEQLNHMLLLAELRAVVVSGPVRGRKETDHGYVLVDETVPPSAPLERDDAVQRLVERFVRGHGPASDRDFSRWCTIGLSETRVALDALVADGRLERMEVAGEAQWHAPAERPRRRRDAPATFLLPVYDEAVLTYPRLNFDAAGDIPEPDPFWAPVVHEQRFVGQWRRTVKGTSVLVETRLAPSLGAAGRESVSLAAAGLARLLDLRLDDVVLR